MVIDIENRAELASLYARLNISPAALKDATAFPKGYKVEDLTDLWVSPAFNAIADATKEEFGS